MKRKLFGAILGVILISIMVVGTVLAFSMGNADGVWEYVEDDSSTQNAYCTTYGTGPGTSETARSRNDPSIQGALGGTDENQVHYGKGSSYYNNTCPSTINSDWFDEQSGLGFDGNNNIGSSLTEAVPFWIGRLTHYNRPIYLSDDPTEPPDAGDWNFMEWIDINVRVGGVLCGNGQPPNEGLTLTFTYRVLFDETPNNASPCPYGGNTNGCYDAVTIGTAPPSANFTCDDEDEPAATTGTYTITLLGFQPHSSTDCSTQIYNSSLIQTQFITAERSTNDACLWAQISDFDPTAVTLKDFSAEVLDDEVRLTWETLSEVDTLGFNLYRSASVDGEKLQINEELIDSGLAPGSLDGAFYSFSDVDILPAGTYFYWLEEIELDGDTDLFGPEEAVIE